MDNLIKSLFSSDKPIRLSKNSNTKEIINEAILIDQIGQEKIPEFYNNIGEFGKRDELLGTEPAVKLNDDKCHMLSHSQKAAILALAKDDNSSDYQMFMKAAEAKKAYFERLIKRYGETANMKVAEQTQELNSNSRVQDALAKTQESCKESCK